MSKKPAFIYHRCNMPATLRSALKHSFDGVEFDLRKTTDGTIIVHHDRRIKDGDARYHWIDKMKYAEVKGILGNALMTFEEALEIVVEKNLILDLDLKQSGMEKEIARLVKKFGIDERQIIVCSPDIWVLKAIEDKLPLAKIGLTYSPNDKYDLSQSKLFHYLAILMYYSLKPFIFRLIRRKSAKGDIQVASIQHKLVSKKVIQFLHDYDIEIYAWGTDSKKKIQDMKTWGVDGVKVKNEKALHARYI